MKRRLHSLGLERYLDCFVFRDYKERSPLDRKPLRAIALTDKYNRVWIEKVLVKIFNISSKSA
jgi:hypothetical protein